MPTVNITWYKILEPGISHVFAEEYGSLDFRMNFDELIDRLAMRVVAHDGDYNYVSCLIDQALVIDDRFDIIDETIRRLARELKLMKIVIPKTEIIMAIKPFKIIEELM